MKKPVRLVAIRRHAERVRSIIAAREQSNPVVSGASGSDVRHQERLRQINDCVKKINQKEMLAGGSALDRTDKIKSLMEMFQVPV